MNNWNLISANLIGREHELSKRNNQDFCKTYQNDNIIIGVICDGCSEGAHSEFGAKFVGNILLKYLKISSHIEWENTTMTPEAYYNSFIISELENVISKFNTFNTTEEKVKIIKDYFLCTTVFFMISKHTGKILIGNSGDGVVIIENQILRNDQNDKPHYLAYQCIPNEYLSMNRNEMTSLYITIHNFNYFDRFAIGSDGLLALPNLQEIFGKKGRQLQRMFNVYQAKQKLFGDDTSCIILEKEEIKSENNLSK